MRTACLGSLIAATLALGCGGDDDDSTNNADRFEGAEGDVAALIDEFAAAGRDGDWARVCDEIFAEALTNSIERAAGQSCATEVEQELTEDEYELEVGAVEVNGATATATVTDRADNESQLHLVKTGEDWRILRVTGVP